MDKHLCFCDRCKKDLDYGLTHHQIRLCLDDNRSEYVADVCAKCFEEMKGIIEKELEFSDFVR